LLLVRTIILHVIDTRRIILLYRFLFGVPPERVLIRAKTFHYELEIYMFMKLSNHLSEIPRYLEDKEKRKADTKLLNELCLVKDLKDYYSSLLQYKEKRAKIGDSALTDFY